MPGEALSYPLPDFAWSDGTLGAVARVLRAFHDASAGFTPTTDGGWRWPAHEPAEVICHNDFRPVQPDVLRTAGSRASSISDLASPGPRVLDLGYAAYRSVPLSDPANPDAPYAGASEQVRRLEVFCAAYGDPRIRPSDTVEAAAAKLRELVAFIEREAAAGEPAQQAVMGRGDIAIYERDIAYLEQFG